MSRTEPKWRNGVPGTILVAEAPGLVVPTWHMAQPPVGLLAVILVTWGVGTSV